ncbi:hypothetical protein HYU17_02790 [Candidatus Woesearchaeota archaeon]|nr:hypothetical protein [Candidatus Woesearchaeota archaeon]
MKTRANKNNCSGYRSGFVVAALLAAVAVLVSGCYYTDDYLSSSEHYLAGWVLHNVDGSTKTDLGYSKADVAELNYSYGFPSSVPVEFGSVNWWVMPVHEYGGSLQFGQDPVFPAPLNTTYYVFGQDGPEEFYATKWSFSTELFHRYTVEGPEGVLPSASQFYPSDDAGYSPVAGESRSVLLGSPPFLPTSVFVKDMGGGEARITLSDPLLRLGNGEGFVSYYTEGDVCGETSCEHKQFFAAPAYKVVAADGKVVEEGELTEGVGATVSKISHKALRRTVDLPGTYRVELTIPAPYEIWNLTEINASFTYPASDISPPRLEKVDVSPRFTPGSALPVFVWFSDNTLVSSVEIYARISPASEWQKLSAGGESGTFEASFTPQESAERVDIRLVAKDSSGNEVSYIINYASLPAVETRLTLDAPTQLTKLQKVHLSGTCSHANGQQCNEEIVSIQVDDSEAARAIAREGEFELDFTMPENALPESKLSAAFLGTGTLSPASTASSVTVPSHGLDVGVAGLSVRDALFGEPFKVSARVVNVGSLEAKDVLVEFFDDSGNGADLLDRLRIPSLAVGESKPVSFEFFPEEGYHRLAIRATAPDDENSLNDLFSEEFDVNYNAPDVSVYVEPAKTVTVVNTKTGVVLRIANNGEVKATGIKAQLFDLYEPVYKYINLEDTGCPTTGGSGGGGGGGRSGSVPAASEVKAAEPEPAPGEPILCPGGGGGVIEQPVKPEETSSSAKEGEKGKDKAKGGEGVPGEPGGPGGGGSPVKPVKHYVTYNSTEYEIEAVRDGKSIVLTVSKKGEPETAEKLTFSKTSRVQRLSSGVHFFMEYSNSFGSEFYVGTATVSEKQVGNLDSWDGINAVVDWTPGAIGKYLLVGFASVDLDSYAGNNYDRREGRSMREGVNVEGSLNVDFDKKFVTGVKSAVQAEVRSVGSEPAKKVVVSLYENEISDEGNLVVEARSGGTVSPSAVKGTLIGTQTIDALAVKQSKTLSFSWIPKKAGERLLKLITETKRDIDPSDNDATRFVRVVPQDKADLSVYIYYPDENPVVGQAVNVRVEAVNIGMKAAESTVASLYEVKGEADRKLVGKKELGTVAPGEYVEFGFDWTPSFAGDVPLELVVEAANEGNEENNNDSRTVFVKRNGKDVELSSLEVSEIVLAGTHNYVYALLANLGTAEPEPFNVTLEADGVVVSTAHDISFYEYSDMHYVDFDWTPPKPGKYVLEAEHNLTDDNRLNNAKPVEVVVVGQKKVNVTFQDPDGKPAVRSAAIGDYGLDVEGTAEFTVPDAPADFWIGLNDDDNFVVSVYKQSRLVENTTIVTSHSTVPSLQNGVLVYESFANNASWEYGSASWFLGRRLSDLDIRYTELKAFACEDFDFASLKCNGWKEVPSELVVSEGNLFVTAAASKAKAFAIGDMDYDDDNQPDWDDTDADNDGVDDSEDSFICFNGRLKSSRLDVSVDGSSGAKDVEGKKKVNFKDGEKQVAEFTADFDKNGLDCREVIAETQPESAKAGYVLVSGVAATEPKTIFVDKIAKVSRVCVKDAEISSISEVSQSCTGSNEYVVLCNGVKQGSYTCSESADQYIISGLSNSAVVELAECQESWSCTGWTQCVSGKQAKTCTDATNCGTGFSKPAEEQLCSVEGSAGVGSGGSGGSGGGGGGGTVAGRVFAFSDIDAWPVGKTQQLRAKEKDIIAFSFGKRSYRLTIRDVRAASVSMDFSLAAKALTLNKAETRLVDLNGDGKEDIAITFINLDFNNAVISLQKVEQKPDGVQKEAAAKPKPAEQAKSETKLKAEQPSPQLQPAAPPLEQPAKPKKLSLGKAGKSALLALVIAALIAVFMAAVAFFSNTGRRPKHPGQPPYHHPLHHPSNNHASQLHHASAASHPAYHAPVHHVQHAAAYPAQTVHHFPAYAHSAAVPLSASSSPSVAEVEAFINRCLAKGLSSEQIVRLFARAGWDHRLIERVIKVKLSELAGERHRIENSLHMHHAMHKQYN